MKVGGILPLQKLARFKLELSEAVKKEEFEKAARLRDRIQSLEQDLKSQSKRPRRISDAVKAVRALDDTGN